MKDWVTQLRKGLLEFCVLNLLAHREAYGYDIAQRLKALDILSVTESTLYPILARLLDEGLLAVRMSTSSDGPPRRYFSLTPAGRERLSEMNAYWAQLHRTIGLLQQGKLGDGETDDTVA